MSINPFLSLIVAKSRNGVIGKDGDLPWHLSSDLKYFKKATLGKPVLMGRVTWESLPFVLPGRPNLVLSRDKNYEAKGAEVFNSLPDMIGRGFELSGAAGGDEIVIIGGAKLYGLCMKYVRRMYVTEVDVMMEGDAHFPAIMSPDWKILSDTAYEKTARDDHPFNIKVYERR
jgi:dihydrofolate reductase